jgi:hypothetical protein
MDNTNPVPHCRCVECEHHRLRVDGRHRCNVAWGEIPEPRKVRQCMYFERKERK